MTRVPTSLRVTVPSGLGPGEDVAAFPGGLKKRRPESENLCNKLRRGGSGPCKRGGGGHVVQNTRKFRLLKEPTINRY